MMSSPPSQYNYPLPKVGITASQVGTRIPVSVGGSFQQDIWVELNNESPYVLSIFSAQGILLNSLQPQVADIAQIPSGDSLFIIVPSLLIPQASPSSEVDINVYPFGKPEGPYPFPLNRQSAPVSGAVQFGYGLSVLLGSTTGDFSALNVFNPTNSGKNYIIYSELLLHTDTRVDNFIFGLTAGPDNALGGTHPTPQRHDLSSPPSAAVTSANVITALPTVTPQSLPIQIPIQQNVFTQIVTNGNLYVVHPGQNFFLALQSLTGANVNYQVDWYEQ